MEEYKVVDDDDHSQVPDVAAGKVHQFYFVKFDQDQDLNEELDEAMINLRQRQKACDDELRQTRRDIDQKKSEREKLSWGRSYRYWRATDYKYYKQRYDNELKPLQEALKKMSMSSSKTPKENDDTTGCKDNIFPLRKSHYRMLHHGANNLVEEKDTIKEIKEELEEAERVAEEKRIAAQKKVVYYGKYKPKAVPESPSYSLKELKQKIKLKEAQIDGLRMEVRDHRAYENRKAHDIENMNRRIVGLEKKMIRFKQQKDNLDNMFTEMRIDIAEMNQNAIYNRGIVNSALNLAHEKNIEAVRKLSRAGVDKFMSEWNNNAAFRKDYVRRNSDSLERRQLTKDGFSKTPTLRSIVEHN